MINDDKFRKNNEIAGICFPQLNLKTETGCGTVVFRQNQQRDDFDQTLTPEKQEFEV